MFYFLTFPRICLTSFPSSWSLCCCNFPLKHSTLNTGTVCFVMLCVCFFPINPITVVTHYHDQLCSKYFRNICKRFCMYLRLCVFVRLCVFSDYAHVLCTLAEKRQLHLLFLRVLYSCVCPSSLFPLVSPCTTPALLFVAVVTGQPWLLHTRPNPSPRPLVFWRAHPRSGVCTPLSGKS